MPKISITAGTGSNINVFAPVQTVAVTEVIFVSSTSRHLNLLKDSSFVEFVQQLCSLLSADEIRKKDRKLITINLPYMIFCYMGL